MRTILTALFLAASLTVPALAEDPPMGGAWIDCNVASVAAFRDRLIVRCASVAPAKGLQGETEGPPREFAIEAVGPLTEPVLRLAIEAKGRGRPLTILYVREASANPAGCPADRCRRIAAVELK
ncbi:MAG: hypothetical protein Q8L23_08280 [Caulobacter sp.]|nr:hypothetical protein [Caulobacter sp.]